jgi:soluble lytic murein transglycosylase
MRVKAAAASFTLIACGIALPFAAAEDADPAVREQFRAVYAAAAAGLAADDEALRDYVLYPYLRAARIAQELQRTQDAWTATDVATASFLAETGDAPIARTLRRTWLASLARRESWEAFLRHYDGTVATPALECQRFNARIARAETEDLAPAIRARWLSGYRLPSECEPAFQWLRGAGELPDDVIAQRAMLLLDNGQAAFARVIAARLPQDAAAPLLERADFVENPARMLDAVLRDPLPATPPSVVLEAWSRLARNSPQTALTRFDALERRLPGAVRPELALKLAMGLAWDRDSAALDYFARVPAAAFDESALEWRARAAMWAANWDQVRASVAAMSPKHQSDWAWRYWAARAAEHFDEGNAVRVLYSAVLDGDNYYSAMAAAHLGERVAPRLEALPLDDAGIEAIAAIDAFRRVRELSLLGLRELANDEWHYGYAQLSEQQRLQAIHLAAHWQIYDIAVATATSHGHFNDYALLYPRPYGDEVAAAVKVTKVEPNVLYGVLRQESLFRADAASSAGALGVAQLTPATARETALRWQLPVPKRQDLFDPTINIALGAARVAELLERFDAQLPVALSAYNAGEAAAKRWLPERPTDNDVWIENIPYNETRSYVRRVLWHSLVFSWLETGRPQSTRDWLGQVENPVADP